MEEIAVIKIGGKIISDPIKLEKALTSFSKIKGNKILIHGGGNRATSLAKELGVEVNIIDGRRITDAPMLEIATMVYAGLINKNIIAKLQSINVNALGLSGADGNLILSDKRAVGKIDYGQVGDVKMVNTDNLFKLLDSGFTPVFCALTHDGKGNLLNTNADSIAAQIAQSFSKEFQVTLTYAFELNGVLTDIKDPNSVIKKITNTSFDEMKADGQISEGMIPKVSNALLASSKGVHKVYICNYGCLQAPDQGTEICLN